MVSEENFPVQVFANPFQFKTATAHLASPEEHSYYAD
jgi:hypothetical protein